MSIDTNKIKIQSIVNVFETGSATGDYSNVSIYSDGPGNKKQITYGKAQTTEFGNLSKLLTSYVSNNGKYADDIKPYLSRIGKGSSLYNESRLIAALKSAGDDNIMKQTQDDFFNTVYWMPALNWFNSKQFTEALSMLVIYDSFIHSGSIMQFLRNRFSEKVPVAGGSERRWINEYVNTRHNWLSTHTSRPILRKTIYRTQCFKDQIAKNNWDLKQVVLAKNINIL
jgi:chitosanase